MKEIIRYCDRDLHKDKKELAVVFGIHIHIGTTSQGSGSSENMYQIVDLCGLCATGFFQHIFNNRHKFDAQTNLQVLKSFGIREHANV